MHRVNRHRVIRSAAWAVIVAAAVLAALTGCGSASTPGQAPQARMASAGPHGAPSVVLTPLGAQRIGIQTAPSVAAKKLIIVPFQALLYEPDGRTVVYTRTGTYTYTRQYVTVASINGNQVLVSAGLPAGVPVVTVGAEELLGVQNGVGVQT